MPPSSSDQAVPTSLVDDMFLLGATEDGNPGLPDLPLLVCGAALADLDLRERLTCPTRTVHVEDDTPTGHPALDGLLARVAGIRRGRTAGRWVFDTAREVARAEANHLVDAGVLDEEHDTVLGLLPRHRYPLRDTAARRAVLDRVRRVVLDGGDADEPTTLLVSLLATAAHPRRVAAALFPELDGRTTRARLADAAHPHWAVAGAQRAVRLTHAARA